MTSVFNCAAEQGIDDCVHRIGRTGRAGNLVRLSPAPPPLSVSPLLIRFTRASRGGKVVVAVKAAAGAALGRHKASQVAENAASQRIDTSPTRAAAANLPAK